MGLWPLLLSCILLALCTADQVIGTVNSMIDPNRVTWWRYKWAPAPIQLSINNVSSTASITFYINPSTSIPNGVFEVTFPYGFLPVAFGAATFTGQVLQITGQTFIAGVDSVVVIPGQSTPVLSGPYGPFAIRTRYSANSQQADVNLTFGSVFITPAANTLSALSVTVLDASYTGTVVNTPGVTLSFAFILGVSLWRYDTFIIVTDPRWTVNSGASCGSVKTAGYWNNLNGTSSAYPYALDCVFTSQTSTNPSQSIYIYGLAVDGLDLVVTGNRYVTLTVSSVTAPNAVYTTAAYTWTVSTSRFGTTTILETGQATSGPTITTGTITTVSWLPTWGTTTANIAQGTSFFMDLSFTIVNPIPVITPNTNLGSIVITVSENSATANAESNWIPTTLAPNCYIVTYFPGAFAPTCVYSGNTITISQLPQVAAGVIQVRNIVTFTQTSESVTSINTYADGSILQVDATAQPLASFSPIDPSINIVAFTTAATNFQVQFQSISSTPAVVTSLAGGSGDGTQSVQFYLGLGAFVVDTETSFNIYCPITYTLDNFNLGIPSPSYFYVNDANTGFTAIDIACDSSTCTTFTLLSPSIPQLVPNTAGTTSITPGVISFSGNLITISATELHLLLWSSSTAPYITLPTIANNLATAYECTAVLSSSILGTPTTASGAIRFVISPQSWYMNTFTLPCTAYIDGTPAIITLQPNVVSIGSSLTATYYVEVKFTGMTGVFGTNSGLVATTAPPGGNFEGQLTTGYTSLYTVSVSSTSSTQVTFSSPVYYTGTNSITVAVPGLTLPAYESASTPSTTLVFPIGGFAVNSSIPAPTITSYFILTSDPRYKYITHNQVSSSGAFVTAATTTSTTTTNLISAITGATSPIPTGTYAASLQLGLLVNAFATTNYYIFFQLGTGSIWSNSQAITSAVAGSTYANTYYFSLGTGFGYPGVLLASTIAGNGFTNVASGWSNTATDTTTTVTLTGFNVPLGTGTAYVNMLIGTGAGACNFIANNASTLQYSISPGTITNVSVSPISVSGSAVSISQSVIFTLPHSIPLGGSIVLNYSSSWVSTYVNPVCVTTGLMNASTSTPVSCIVAGNVVTVTGFAALSIASSNIVNIAISRLIAPTYSITSTSFNFVTSIVSYTGATTITPIIDSVSAPSNAVTITPAATVGTTTWTTKTVYPSTAGVSAASDLYLKFSLPHSLPAGGVITLTSPLSFSLSLGSISNYCFFTIPYISCNVATSTSLIITLAQDYTGRGVLELYLDAAVINPSTTTTTTTAFSIVSTWGTVILDNDGTTSTANFTPTALLSSAITAVNAGLSFAPTTAGEVATYTFDFTDTVAYTVGDQYWILFPAQFDYFLGDVWIWFTNEPNTYYIECNSAQLGVTWCRVDHSIVVVTGSTAVTASTEIVININNIINPPGSVMPTDAFMIYHLNSIGSYLTINQSFGTVTPSFQAENNVYVRSLVQTSHLLFQSSDYTWRLYISDIMYSDSQLQVLFPREYDLNKFDHKMTYNCSSSYMVYSATTPSTTLTWNSASLCSVNNNLVTLPPSTISTSTTFTTANVGGNVVSWTVQSVNNTQWAQLRKAANAYTDFDVTDSALWPIYTYWSTKFTFFIYRASSTNLVYTSRSYPNTNAAYTGFFDWLKPLYVNFYSPQNKLNRIVVYAGTQTTDIYISTASPFLPLSAMQIVFTPTTNRNTPDRGRLKYTSVLDNWTLYQTYWQIRFRVAAAIDLIKGLYYINWFSVETKQIGLSSLQYDTPVSTLVEVIANTTAACAFALGTIPTLIPGYSSVPIKVSLTNAPHADVTVNIYVLGSVAHISVNPSNLTFGPDINSLYFQVNVTSDYDITLGSMQSLSFNLTGTDATVYSVPAIQQFTISQSNTNSTDGVIVSWGLATATKTTQMSSPSSDQVGVIYYQLSASGAVIPSFSTLKTNVGSLVTTLSSGSNTQSDPAPGESWAHFQWRLYKTHLQQVWIGSLSMPTTTASTPLLFTWLYANTTYQLSGYLDNLNISTNPTVHTEFFNTASIASPQPFTLEFSGSVSINLGFKIAQEVATLQGVNPLRLGNATVTIARRLVNTISTTSFLYTLVPNRFSESPDPSAQAALSSIQQTSLAANLANDGVTNAKLNSITLNPAPSRTVPAWTNIPTSGGATTNSLIVTLRSNTAGLTCCVALTSSTTAPTPDQIMLGLSPTNKVAPNSCGASNITVATNSLQISSLTADTPYYVYCTATDTYPLWPTQMAYSNSNPLMAVVITTLSNSTYTAVTSASYFGGLLLLLALLLH